MSSLHVGQKVTLLTISEVLATTQRVQLEVRQVIEPATPVEGGRRLRIAIVRLRGRRKDVYLDVAADDIVLDGWELPFRTDVEVGGATDGNACFNLVGDAGDIRELIEGKAALPVSGRAKA